VVVSAAKPDARATTELHPRQIPYNRHLPVRSTAGDGRILGTDACTGRLELNGQLRLNNPRTLAGERSNGWPAAL